MTTIRTTAGLILATTLALGMGACSSTASGGSGEFCEVLKSDSDTAATAFTVVISGMRDKASVETQKDLVDRIETAPEGLDDELATWKAYMDAALTNFDDPTALIQAYTPEAQAVGEALTEAYTTTCM